MPADAPAKLPEIEHIKARKDGLDVLADIYRYAELGFDAIAPDDLTLFRWYGIYTQRAEQSAATCVSLGPSALSRWGLSLLTRTAWSPWILRPTLLVDSSAVTTNSPALRSAANALNEKDLSFQMRGLPVR